MNIWTKLDNGWGIRVADTEPRPGEAVKVTKKDGTASLETGETHTITVWFGIAFLARRLNIGRRWKPR